VVCGGVVEVNRHFHQAQSQDARIEVYVALRIAGDGGYMMNAQDVVLHVPALFICKFHLHLGMPAQADDCPDHFARPLSSLP